MGHVKVTVGIKLELTNWMVFHFKDKTFFALIFFTNLPESQT
jgi:hypothetical protein